MLAPGSHLYDHGVPEFAFVLAERQNLFFVELVEAVRYELSQLGVPSSVSRSGFPPGRDDLVYVVLAPHEFFLLEGYRGMPLPSQAILSRTILICAEQPSMGVFDDNVRLAPLAGAVFDLNRSGVREFARRGFTAGHFQLGYSPLWDRFGLSEERDVDVLFLGCRSPRRGQWLASYADVLWPRATRLVVSDNEQPNAEPSESFLTGSDKLELLARSKVLLNIHQGPDPYFEWLRVVQAIPCGCVVVSEHSEDIAPLRAGIDVELGRPETLALLAERLLDDEAELDRMRRSAYDQLRERIPLRRAVEELAEVGELVAARPLRSAAAPGWRSGRPSLVRRTEPWPRPEPDPVDAVRAAMKALALDRLQAVRAEAARDLAARDVPATQEVRRSLAYGGASPKVSILVTVLDYADLVTNALASAAAGTYAEIELVVVDDGSSDASVDCVAAWIGEHEWVPAILVRHVANRGLGPARNTALELARGELVFVLDADNALFPNGLKKLVEALDRDEGAAFAYGMLQGKLAGEPYSLLNELPWDPERFRRGNYVDAMALLRAQALREAGGYTEDVRFHGAEDYELWCRLAELGHRGVLVPEIVASYRLSSHSMQSLTNLSVDVIESLLAERYPRTKGIVWPAA